MRRLALVLACLLGLASGCATVSHDHRMLPPPPTTGRTLVVGIGLDRENRPTVQALVRAVTRELDDRWGSVFEARAFLGQPTRSGSPIPVERLEGVAAGAVLDRELAEALNREYGIQTLVFLDVRVFEQEWGPETKRTRIKLVAWAVDLGQLRPIWRATSAPEVEGESGRSFQMASEAAIQGLVRAILGESRPQWPFTLFNGR